MYNQAPEAGLASLLASRGRNGDTMLVHMGPEEVAGLRRLAMAHGGDLEVNPDTGLYQANFLKKILPMVIGAVLPGVPVLGDLAKGIGTTLGASGAAAANLGGALLVGGATALIEGDLKKGLMAGLGAYSGGTLRQSFQEASIPAVEKVSAEEIAKTNRAIDVAKETVGATPVDIDPTMGGRGADLLSRYSTPATTTPMPSVPSDGLDYFKSANVFRGSPITDAAGKITGYNALQGAPTAAGLAAGRAAIAADTGIRGVLGGAQGLFSSPASRAAFAQGLGGGFQSPLMQNLSRYATFAGVADALTPEVEMPSGQPAGENIIYIPGERDPMYGLGRQYSYYKPGRYYKKTLQGLVPYNPNQMAPGYSSSSTLYGAEGGIASGLPRYAAGGSVQPINQDINQQRALPHQVMPYPAPNENYPLSTVTRINYSGSPQSREILSGYEANIDPFTGEEKFARGGRIDEPDMFMQEDRFDNPFVEQAQPAVQYVAPAIVEAPIPMVGVAPPNPFAGDQIGFPMRTSMMTAPEVETAMPMPGSEQVTAPPPIPDTFLNRNPFAQEVETTMPVPGSEQVTVPRSAAQPPVAAASAPSTFVPGSFLNRGMALPPSPRASGQEQYDYALGQYEKEQFSQAQSIMAMNPNMSFDQAMAFVKSRPSGAPPDPAAFGVTGSKATATTVDPSANWNWGSNLKIDPSVRMGEFDWQKYILANPDLEKAGIDTPWEAMAHYSTYGKTENRPGVSFGGFATPEEFQTNRQAQIDAMRGDGGIPGVRSPFVVDKIPLPSPPPTGGVSTPPPTTGAPSPAPSPPTGTDRPKRPAPTPPPMYTPEGLADARKRYQQMLYGAPPAPTNVSPVMDYLASLNRRVASQVAYPYPRGGIAGTPAPAPSPRPGGPETPGDKREPKVTPGGVYPPSPPFPTFPPSTPGTTPAPAPAPDDKGDEESAFDKFKKWVRQKYEDTDLFDLIGLGVGAQYGFLANVLWNQLTPSLKKAFGIETTELSPEQVAELDAKAKEEADKIKKEKEAEAAKETSRGDRGTRESSKTAGGYTPPVFSPSTGGIGGLMGRRGQISILPPIKAAAEGGHIRAMQTGGMTVPNPYGAAVGEDYNFGFAGGGEMPTEYLAGGKLLDGPGDGMSDDIPAVIRGKGVQRAALADGEFVVPADVVSHLGNGSTKAGAKKLYAMMDRIREARTGKTRQAPAVKADRYLPA